LKASVIIPAYNASPWIEQAVASAWDQTRKPDEVIVASDGSTDDTAQKAKAAGAKVLELPKGNANVARNAGVRESVGQLLFFLDADDWFMPEKVERHIAVHDAGTWSMVVDPATTIDEQGQPGRLVAAALDGPLRYQSFLSRSYWYGGSSFSVSRSRLEEIGGWREELRSQQDIDLWLRLAFRHGPCYVLGKSYTWYRLTAGSTSRSPKNVLENLDVLTRGLSFLSYSQRRKLRSQVIFTAADNLRPNTALPLLARAADRFYDPRFIKAIARSFRNARR
jgi:glycosyltransferase involved in cell wall biosynthesis